MRNLLLLYIAQLSFGTAVLFSQESGDVWMRKIYDIEFEYGNCIIYKEDESIILASIYSTVNSDIGVNLRLIDANGCDINIYDSGLPEDLVDVRFYDFTATNDGGYIASGSIFISDSL